MNRIAELATVIDRHTVGTGICTTAIPHVSLIRADAPSTATPAVYEASICLIAQGSKRVSIGEHSVVYDAAHYLLVSVDLPLVGHVLDASPERPYLCCKVDLDRAMLADLMVSEGGAVPRTDLPVLGVYPSDPDLVDAACRLVALLDRPETIRPLAPLIEREILYRLLTGPHGPMLRHVATAGSHLNQPRDCHHPSSFRCAAPHRRRCRRGGHEPVIAPRALQSDHAHDAVGIPEAVAVAGGQAIDAGAGRYGERGRLCRWLREPVAIQP